MASSNYGPLSEGIWGKQDVTAFFEKGAAAITSTAQAEEERREAVAAATAHRELVEALATADKQHDKTVNAALSQCEEALAAIEKAGEEKA